MTAKRYMMATAAYHMLGDISRDEPSLARITGETPDGLFWIGHFVEGFGFVEVRFPKATTRDLTDDEAAFYDGRGVAIGHDVIGVISVDPTHRKESA